MPHHVRLYKRVAIRAAMMVIIIIMHQYDIERYFVISYVDSLDNKIQAGKFSPIY